MTFQIKRVYEPALPTDGTRVLVDRLWPRGVRKSDANWSHWMKEVAPSPHLRRWFDHRPERFQQFSARYKEELQESAAVKQLQTLGRRHRVTLLYAAHDPHVNHAAVLLSFLHGPSSS